MKKLLLLALLVICLLTSTSCSKNKEPTPPDTSAYKQFLLGTWFSISSTEVTTSSSGQSTSKTMNFDHGDLSETYTATTVIAYFKNSVATDRPYTLSGNTYVVQDGAFAKTYEIISLSSSSFVRKYTTTYGTDIIVTTTTLVR
jgi:hypothetical protein